MTIIQGEVRQQLAFVELGRFEQFLAFLH
jgi:hypothetical protein